MKSYSKSEEERQRDFFNKIHKGSLKDKPSHFLKDNNIWLNFHDDIVSDVKQYFDENDIQLSDQVATRNVKASQACCFNHLFILKNNKELATAVLKKIDGRFEEAIFIDTGYVEFEVMEGKKKNPLGEKPNNNLRKRGARSTSIDVLMIGKIKKENKTILVLVLVEWKYTESSNGKMPKNSNWEVYKDWLKTTGCPIIVEKENGDIVDDDYKNLYYKTYYQLMRQTLLGWQMAEELHEFDCVKYIHVNIIPKKNLVLNKLCDNWKNRLDNSHKEDYKILSPDNIFEIYEKYNKSLWNYLKERYW